MTIAVGILLFVCAIVALFIPDMRKGWQLCIKLFLAAAHVAAGVMCITNEAQWVQVTIGIILCIWACAALSDVVRILGTPYSPSMGPGASESLLGLCARIVFFLWSLIFTILQFAIVV